jgi:hypothetical protein
MLGGGTASATLLGFVAVRTVGDVITRISPATHAATQQLVLHAGTDVRQILGGLGALGLAALSVACGKKAAATAPASAPGRHRAG